MSDEEANYGLVLSFSGLYPTDAEEHAFVHGVEFGRLYDRMTSGTEAEIEETTHTANREIIKRSAAAKGWTAEIKPSGTEGWDFVKLTKTRAERPNPHGLRLVT